MASVMAAPPTPLKGGWQLNPVRFMQLALATTVAFSVVYMAQFMASSVESGAGFSSAVRSRLLGKTQYVVQGFDEGYKFVSTYDVETQGPLFVLFMSDADENGTYWCADCERAKQPVYDAFARAPRGSRLVEIRVGPEEYWADNGNEFRQNQLFYIDYIPTLMRYDGRGNSSTMVNERGCTNKELLDFVFRVPRPSGPPLKGNEVVTLTTPSAIIEYVTAFDTDVRPLFIFFVSGVHSFNGRLWCHYCDRADVAVMHYFNTTAPANAVLIRAVVAESYKAWKKKKNPFKGAEFREKIAAVRGVPFLGRLTKHQDMNTPRMTEYYPEFDAYEDLQRFYEGE